MWTSSLRLRGGVLGTGACLAALACAANGWAAGGTPMPAPDDPPPAYQTSTVKTSASTTAPKAPRAKRVAEPAPSGADARRPDRRGVDARRRRRPTAKQAAVPAPDPSPSAASRIVRPECLDVAPCECGWHRARDDSRPSLDVHSAAFRAEAERRSRSRAAEDRGHQGEADGDPSRRPAPGRRAARSAGRSARRPRARR